MKSIPVPKGYRFGAAAAGFRKSGRLDLGLVESRPEAVVAGVFTTNRFKAAPVLVGMEMLEAGERAGALLVNAGRANACTGEEGVADCRVTQETAATALGISERQIWPASTGVIGERLHLDCFHAAMPDLVSALETAGPTDFARAIMTTDTFPKISWGRVRVGDKRVRVLGVAKGAGMICPNMATMLAFILCDARIDPDAWQAMLTRAVDGSFNRITVDGDTSTNDTVLALANGASEVDLDAGGIEDLECVLTEVCRALAYKIVQDAEGGTKVLRVRVGGARNVEQARMCAKAVCESPLVKTAMFGHDPNWGRIVAAIGRSGAEFDADDVVLAIGSIPVFEAGRPTTDDIDALLGAAMKRQDITIDVDLGAGEAEHEMLASDLTHEYVSINADYRS